MKLRTAFCVFAGAMLVAGGAAGQPELETTPPPAPAVPAPPKPSTEAVVAPKDETEAALAPAPGGLTADRVGERAIANSHLVRARLADLDAARAKSDQTMAQFLPRLALKASYTRLSKVESSFGGGAIVGAAHPGPITVGPCPGGAGQCALDSQGTPIGAQAFSFPSLRDVYSTSATLTVPLSDYVLRLSSAAAGSSANKRAAELSVKAERLKAKTDAQALFYDWIRAQGRVAIAEKSLERTRARVKDARPAFEVGVITKADLMRLEALEASTEQVLLESRTFRDLAERQLAVIMGDKKRPHYQIGEDLNGVPALTAGDLDGMTKEALSRRLEIRALEEAGRAARHGARALRTGSIPRLDAFGDVTYANPNQRYFPQQDKWRSTWSVGVAATWNVTDVFLTQAQGNELDATARSLEAQRAALADGVEQEVTAQYLSREKAQGALKSTRRGVAAASEAYRVAVDLHRAGKATTTEVIDAETDLLAARLAEINARIDLRIAEARLRHAVGRDVTK